MGALRTLCTWYEVEEEGRFRAPSFAPALRTLERTRRAKPLVYTLAEQAQVLAEIPDEDRGVFLALARFALRPGEARAILAEDRDAKRREITVWRAMDGKGSRIEPRDSTKTEAVQTDRESPDLSAWIERHRANAIGLAPLFPNPRTRHPYGHRYLNGIWNRAVQAADRRSRVAGGPGLHHVPLNRGTRHSTLDGLKDALTPMQLRDFGRHERVETTESNYLASRPPLELAEVPTLLERLSR